MMFADCGQSGGDQVVAELADPGVTAARSAVMAPNGASRTVARTRCDLGAEQSPQTILQVESRRKGWVSSLNAVRAGTAAKSRVSTRPATVDN
jgi:hypothetical protein